MWVLIQMGEPVLGPLLEHFLPRYTDGINRDVVLVMAAIARAAHASGAPDLFEQVRMRNLETSLATVLWLADLAGDDTAREKWERLSDSVEPADNAGVMDKETSITLWAEDERTAARLTSDAYYLAGVLTADGSASATGFLEALREGGSLSSEVRSNPSRGGFDVLLVVRFQR